MKLYQLIQTNNWLSIQFALLNLYPDQEDNISAYESIFSELKQMSEVNTDMQIVLKQCFDEETNEKSYVDVSGSKEGNDIGIFSESYAIEFTPWNEWLGMTIQKETFSEFNELEILSHCLYEMTFIGYNEEDIQGQFSDLNDDIEKYKSMTDEEKKNSAKSLDDFLKEDSDE